MFLISPKKSGVTLIEALVTVSLFSLAFVALFSVLKVGTDAWKQTESRNNVQTIMRKLEVYLLDDLRRASGEFIRKKNITASGTTSTFPVLWFLSAVGEDSVASGGDSGYAFAREFGRSSSGTPVWRRNVIYYLTPIESKFHRERFGFNCANPGKCPHKWLVRKEVVYHAEADTEGTSFAPSVLIPEDKILNYISEPSDYNLSASLNDPNNTNTDGCKKVVLMADCITNFSVSFPGGGSTYKYSDKTDAKNGITVSISAFRYDEATRHMTVGADTMDLAVKRFSLKYDLRVIPNN